MIKYLYITAFVFNSNSLGNAQNYFNVWGPGLKPQDIIMPARYFFISYTNHSCTNRLYFDVEINGKNNKQNPCRIWTNVLSTQHCLSIVRYKLYEICVGLEISIKYKNEHLAASPYLVKDYIFPDDCSCNIMNLNTWLKKWDCGKVPNQVTTDLAKFAYINFNNLRSKIIKAYDNPGAVSICHYIIKNNDIYQKCYGKYVGFKMFMDNILLSLTRKVVLPDIEFFVNLGDWPLAKTNEFPIFSWCGSDDSYDIVLPTYDITESTLENMGRVMLDMLSVQGNVHSFWHQRIPKVFWRGRDSNHERFILIDLSQQYPHLFNASFTNFFFFRDKEDEYGPKSEHVSFFNFFDYKYQVNIDGTVAAYRFPYLLAGGSLVFKQESKYYEHFYKDLKPDHHYIPIKRDLSDLMEKLKWASNNDDKAKAIAYNGWEYAADNLLPKDIFCYHVHLLNKFSNKITNNIHKLKDMELVSNNKCDCIKTKEEL